jgi:FkbM family methyltransferase
MAHAVLRKLPAGTAFPVLSGPMRGQRWIVAAGDNSCWLGTYELEKQRLLHRLLRPGDVFYDLGAHSGLFTLLGARIVEQTGRVVAFEPNTASVANLRRHVALNTLNNVVVVQAAVSNRRGRAKFTPAGSLSGDLAGLPLSNYLGRLDVRGSLEVEVTTLDEARVENQLPPPNVIKIDIEGAEVDALLGAESLLKTHHPIILLATHGEGLAEQCRSLLNELRYSCRAMPTDHNELIFSPPGA